jgi:hypothetical protein
VITIFTNEEELSDSFVVTFCFLMSYTIKKKRWKMRNLFKPNSV